VPSIHTSVYLPGIGESRGSFDERPSEELYDLTVDPDEVVNLAADPSHATVMADLRKQLQDWRAATHDPWLAGITDPFGHAH